MADWGLGAGQSAVAYGYDAATTAGVTLTSGTANTKGVWAEIIASTTQSSNWMMVHITNLVSATGYLIDIGIGAAAAEYVLIPDLMVSNGRTKEVGFSVSFPVHIRSGVRLAARCQAVTASSTCQVSVTAMGSGFAQASPMQRVTAYGTSAATSRGADHTPGLNTKPAWVEIVASTANPTKWVVVAHHLRADTAVVVASRSIDIGVGAAAAEYVAIPDLRETAAAIADTPYPGFYGPFPLELPAGVRLAVRSSTSATGENDSTAVYGID